MHTVDCTDTKTISDSYNRPPQGTEDWQIPLKENFDEWGST